ncbi:hypothetical protein CCR75_004580 [Bremia lactucae]|uniref:EF-hand domain-containing protein n=1 Tax=Bremia lactucae TaxID=4779 RepID=A0A976FM18_BRELC|nr:hypothetical protein CCR75_004580 [Bremia lactucae]
MAMLSRRLCAHMTQNCIRISRASFFSFPSPSRSLVKSHTEKRVVPFSCTEMFDVVADVARYSEFLPFCVESRVLRRPNENVMEAALRVGFRIFTESYTSRVIMIRPCPTPGSCEVDFKVTFEVSSFLRANAIKLFFDDVALTQLNAFINRARKIHGTAPRTRPHAFVEDAVTKNKSAQTVTSECTAYGGSIAKPSLADKNEKNHEVGPTASASPRIKGGISAQTYSDLAAVFVDYADKNGKLYYGGFTAACMALSDEYDNMKDITESAALAGAVFTSFETHAMPKDWLSLDEFVEGVYLMTKGTFEQKAHSLFVIVNKTGNGKITREELSQAMQRRIRAVKKLFPKLLRDQVQIQMAHEQVKELSSVQDAAMTSSVKAIEKLMEEVEKEIPLAVNQIFLEADFDQDDYIREQEWMFAWQAHPELVELMTIDGMKKMVQWASVVQEAGKGNGDDNTTGSLEQSLDTRLTYVD